MICLIAASYRYARKFALSQHLNDDEWFWGAAAEEIMSKRNFHTLLVLDGIENVNNQYINTMLELAWKCGRKK